MMFLSELPPLLFLIVGLVLLLRGADWLVEGAVAIARRMGWSPLIIGLTLVAFGTSAPELAVNVFAAVSGNVGLSFGNIIGSNIANIGLVIGVGAIIAPMDVHSRVIRRELPWLLVVTVGTIGLIFFGPTMLQSEAGPFVYGIHRLDGLLMLIVFVSFCFFWYRTARADKWDPLTVEAVREAQEMAAESPLKSWMLFAIGLVGLLVGGKLTETGAVGIAKWLGFSDTLIGMTIVAIATSLPEVFTVIAAARKGHPDIAVGNVVGSNIFNLLLVLGITAMIGPIPLPPGGLADLLVMLGMTVLLMLVVVTSRKRQVNRIEGGVMLALFAAYLSYRVLGEAL